MDTELMTQTTCPMDMLEEYQMEATDVLELCKKKWKYIAMDEDGRWFLFTRKPHIEGSIWFLDNIQFDESMEATEMVNIKPMRPWQNSLLEAIDDNQ